VLAYEKDPATGIVRHLDDQCIGCQYCVLKCPYDVPKYNPKRGIVRKCDMCSSRLAVSEAPACAEACPNGAIRIRVVDATRVARDAEADDFLPGAPGPEYTLPTTHYKTSRPLPRNLLAADHYRVAPEHAHLPLVFMLVLTQLSVGAFVVGQVLAWAADGKMVAALRPLHALAALAVAVVALGASVLHLGRPLFAFRAVVGLRTSWLSREIVAFGLFAGLASVFAAGSWLWRGGGSVATLNALGASVCVAGLAAVFCSVMVYHDTRRAFWRGPFTAVNFGLTTLLLGIATLFVSALSAAALHPSLPLLDLVRGWGRTACVWLAALAGLKLLLGVAPLLHLRDRRHTPMRRTARLLSGPLLHPLIARTVLTLVGGVLLPLIAIAGLGHHPAGVPVSPEDFAILIVAAFLMLVAGELVARYLFFTAVVAPRMPGGLGA
jgi:DMSO reductase anchor subunit/ferredoxin